MIDFDRQLAALNAVRRHPHLVTALSLCDADYSKAAMAFELAIVDWLHRGGKDAAEQRERESKILKDSLRVVDKYNGIIVNNLGARTLAEAAAPSDILRVVKSVLAQLADDLIDRNPAGMVRRKDSSFFLFLGLHFKRLGLQEPSLKTLETLSEILNETGLDDIKFDSSNAQKTFRTGYGKLPKK